MPTRYPSPRPTNAEMAQFVAMFQDAGLLEVYTDEQGREAYRLTEDGVPGRPHARHGRG